MSINVGGLIAIIVFYLAILVIGILAARKTGFKTQNLKLEEVMLANRSIGWFVGSFTMTATWVGGGYINGTTEAVAFNGGLVWCQAPLGYALSLVFGGLFFAEKLRSSGFTTFLDPFHWKFGDVMNCLLYLPALSGDVFWSAAILAALGASLKVILELNLETAIIVSAAIACLYTLVGGLYSVAYTDIVQLVCIFIGLYLCFPFALTHDAVQPISGHGHEAWLGELTPDYIGNYIDYWLLLILGGIPWQVYWQRVLSAKTVKVSRALSFMAAFGCLIMAAPAVLIGAVATATAVGVIGLGAVSAAVMSSTDSSVLSSSAMFARNIYGVIYTRLFRTKASESSQIWVMRAAQVVITVLACVMALKVDTIYGLWILCSDFVYVILFPQLVCVMYLKGANSYGSFVAFFVAVFFRLMGGDTTLDIPAVIKYPWYQEESNTQLFPFRTLSMLISLFVLIGVSYTTDFLFRESYLPISWDFYKCFPHYRTKSVTDSPHVKDTRTTSHERSDDVTRRRTGVPGPTRHSGLSSNDNVTRDTQITRL